jgi:alcohol dehydrogenase
LHDWTERLALKHLGHFGVESAHIPKIVANARGTSMQTNPVTLTDGEIGEILLTRI